MEKIIYPIRINRYLLLKGYSSRREADRLIEKKQVKINGHLAVLGDKVHEGDSVEVSKKAGVMREKRVYLAYNKPIGIVSHNPQRGQKGIEDVLKYPAKLSPMGRLDKESHGLIIMSNDGRIVDKLLNPKYEHEKEYIVEVNKPIRLEFIREMEKGVNIEGYKTKKAKIKKVSPKVFNIILTEGKKHQIRRMCSALGYNVEDLKRVRVMNINLGKTKTGEYREIKGEELKTFLKSLSL